MKKHSSNLKHITLKSTAVQYDNWRTGAGISEKKSYWLEEGEEVNDTAEGSSDLGDRVVVVQSLTHLQLFCDHMDYSTPGSVLHNLLEFAQTYVPWVNDAV